jgi:hypothetical protein
MMICFVSMMFAELKPFEVQLGVAMSLDDDKSIGDDDTEGRLAGADQVHTDGAQVTPDALAVAASGNSSTATTAAAAAAAGEAEHQTTLVGGLDDAEDDLIDV